MGAFPKEDWSRQVGVVFFLPAHVLMTGQPIMGLLTGGFP